MLEGTMRHQYTPRRATLNRWLVDAPEWVLDVFYHKDFADCYTVFIGGDMLASEGRTYANTCVSYLGMSDNPDNPRGFSQWDALAAWEWSKYRNANARRHRVRWLDLPENVRAHVISRYEAE